MPCIRHIPLYLHKLTALQGNSPVNKDLSKSHTIFIFSQIHHTKLAWKKLNLFIAMPFNYENKNIVNLSLYGS